ncbi:beta strand repeat-containing protein [Vagococcus zengguangii]|uniref:beta strand repeat-containing protein n=1 Tax=Vagococcus zengguangii TaxID=2571750 RepID=UPI001AF02500|nr:hypothetical protein [Vagococcus zengguangii]
MKINKKVIGVLVSLLALISMIIVFDIKTTNADRVGFDRNSMGVYLKDMTDAKNIAVVPNPETQSGIKEYKGSIAGMKEALFDIYQYGDGGNYGIYVGTTVSFDTSIASDTIPANPSATDITFKALESKASTLIFTSTQVDEINNNTVAPTGAKTLTMRTDVYWGTDIVLRNISYSVTNMYLNGHNALFGGGSRSTVISNIYGGSKNQDVTGNPTIEINATGAYTWSIYGGNESGGTLTGNPSIIVNNTSGAISTLSGGAKVGTVTGDTSLEINKTTGGITSVYGGGEGTSGTATANVTGNTSVVINNTGAGITTLSGGVKVGTVDGNTSLIVNDAGGTIANVYGAGQGTSATVTANVKGNVTTSINSTNTASKLRLTNYYGGTAYGDITGNVNNTIKGYGGWSGSADLTGGPHYYGGSRSGNIGGDTTEVSITNNFDTSLFSTGRAIYSGGNSHTGVMRGDIKNTIKAGRKLNKGELTRINGAGDFDAAAPSSTKLSSANIDKYTSDETYVAALESSNYQVYGDIYTDVLDGSVSYGADDYAYIRGFGVKGFLEGNTYVTVGVKNNQYNSFGGDGFVFKAQTIGSFMGTTGVKDYYVTKESNSDATTYGSAFDIVGGGGRITGWSQDVYIKGNTNVVLNNVLARWTYGAGFSGTTYGDTSITLNGGLVDTLEGAGFWDNRIDGNTTATVNNGQINWFLSGGGWHSRKINGNPSVTVNDGVINASMGGTYGEATTHDIYGDSNMLIKGGNFSGVPRTGLNAISGGATNQGTLYGDSNVTIDLRNFKNERQFALPKNTYISAGKPYNAFDGSKLGTDSSNSTNLNIFSDESSGDILNGAIIYGDGGRGTAGQNNTKAGSININIDAPGSSIGSLYATQYKNVSSNKLLRNVNINIERAGSIGGISGGSAESDDNITNQVAANSAVNNKFAKFNIGVPVGGATTAEKQTEPLDITGLGLVNFTELNIENGLQLRANGGNITNGLSATAADHASTYNEFGHIYIKDGAGLGVVKDGNIISGGELNVSGSANIASLPGTGKINLSAVNFEDDKAKLNWIKVGTTGSLVKSNGTYWGTQDAYQVLTINPTVANAGTITPFNFTGIEKETGKTFIGDNDVTGSKNGYGIMIPGSTIDYRVVKGEVADIYKGDGNMFHDVEVETGKEPPFAHPAWGSSAKGVIAKDGILYILSSSGILPTISATPDETSGSWVNQMTIQSTKVGEKAIERPERKDYQDEAWTSTDGDYSYTITSMFSNKAELTSRNIILTSEEAQQINDKADLDKWTEVFGRPFLKTEDLTTEELDQLHQELKPDEYRVIPIDYSVGNNDAENTKAMTVNVIVVGADYAISEDKHVSIHTNKEVEIKQAALATIINNGTYNEFYKNKEQINGFTITSDGQKVNNIVPINGTQHLSELASATTLPTSTDEPYGIVDFNYNGETYQLDRMVKITVKANTVILTVNFLDEAKEPLHDKYEMELEPGTTLDLSADTKIQEDIFNQIATDFKYYIKERPKDETALTVNDDMSVDYIFNGILYFASAPDVIDFGSNSLSLGLNQFGVNQTGLSASLILKDSRRHDSDTPWSLNVRVTQPLSNLLQNHVLDDALKYRNDQELLTLTDTNTPIITDNARITAADGLNVTNSWGKNFTEPGMKVALSPAEYARIGDYSGEVQWTIGFTSE